MINTKMRKILKRWGNTGLGIYLTTDEIRIAGFEEGDIVDIEIKNIEEGNPHG